MKTCNICKETKPFSEYRERIYKRKNGEVRTLRGECRPCLLQIDKERYHANREQFKANSRAWAKNYRKTIIPRIAEYLRASGCIDCGENNPIVLDFDHLEPADKVDGISRLLGKNARWEVIQQEMQKCVVRCANCHRKRTARQFNWLMLQYTEQTGEFSPTEKATEV